MRSLVFFAALSSALALRAENPRNTRPDSAHEQRTLESVKQFARTHSDLVCTQAAFPGTGKTITVEFSGPHPGAASTVDTSSLTQEVFAASSGTQFEWDHWQTSNGKRLTVYRYSYQLDGRTHAGTIFADDNTGAIMRIVFRGAGAPAHLFCAAGTR